MYSYEERMRAVLLYIQYDHSASATVRELGYPTTKMLRRWDRDYEVTGELPTRVNNGEGVGTRYSNSRPLLSISSPTAGAFRERSEHSDIHVAMH